MAWKYDTCGCGQVETEKYVLFIALYMKNKEKDIQGMYTIWKNGVDEYEAINVENGKCSATSNW